MGNCYQRYIEMDRLIRDGTCNTLAKLSRRFKISRRQIMRDLKILKDTYKAPLQSCGARGYRYSDDHWFFPAIGLNGQDLFILGLASRTLEQYRNTPLYDGMRDIFDRLARFVDKREMTIDPVWLGKDITLTGEPARSVNKKTWETALNCLKTRTEATIEYGKPGGNPSKRAVHIWHLLHWRGDWYLVSKDLATDDVRLFALSRVKSIKKNATKYVIPDNFKLEDYIDPDMGIYMNTGAPVTIKVRFNTSAAPYAAERRWHAGQKVTPNTDGSLDLEFKTNQLTQVTSWILSWGKSALVLEPPELVAKLKDHAKALAKQYR